MDIRNRKELRREAAAAVAAAPGDLRLTLLIYLAVTGLSALLVTVLTTVLEQHIAGTGGLQQLGLQSKLSTIESAVPLILGFALLGLDLGRVGVSMRTARRQSVQPRNLLMGYPRFGSLLWACMIQYLLFNFFQSICTFAGSLLYLISPFSNDLIRDILPFVTAETSVMALMEDPEFMDLLAYYSVKTLPLSLAMYAVAAIPIIYRYRMTGFILLDEPRMGAMAAMSQSAALTRGHRFALFRLDLGFWWFYLGLALCGCVGCGGMILDALGVSLPWNPVASFFIFFVAGLALAGGLLYFTLHYVQTTYAMAYDALRPREQPSQGGVVLGNIFDLAREQQDM